MRKLKYVKLFENFETGSGYGSDEFQGEEVTIDFETSKDPEIMKLGHPGKSLMGIIGGIDKKERRIIFFNKEKKHIFTIKYYEAESGEPAGYFEYDNVMNQKLGRVKEAYQGKTLDNIRTKYNWN